MKKLLNVALAVVVTAGLFAGCGQAEQTTVPETDVVETQTEAEVEETETVVEETEAVETETAINGDAIRIGGLSGPTSMGLVKLMEDSANGETANSYEFAELSTDASAFVAPLASGEIDIAAVPSNLAPVIYNNTEGKVKLLAVNTLGVLDIVERGESVQTIADLAGKTIYATGEGATPEYTLRYILTANGMDPDKDITIQWCADTTEALSYVTQDESAIAMLPQPFVTVAMTKVEGLRIALDLNDEWESLDTGCALITGVLVVRTEFAETHAAELEAFLQEYEASVAYTETNPDETAELIEKYGIVPAAVAKTALPGCHITYITGTEMKDAISGYYQILFDQNPASVGGAMPEDDFYYGL